MTSWLISDYETRNEVVSSLINEWDESALHFGAQ